MNHGQRRSRGGSRQRPQDLRFSDPGDDRHGGSEGGYGGHGGGVHPARLTTLIKDCGDLASLHTLVQIHCDEFNGRHIQVAIRKLSDLVQTIRSEGNAGRFNEALWVPLFDRAVVLADSLSADDVALLTYAVSTIEGNGAARFMEKLLSCALQLMGEMPLKELAKFMYGMAHAPTEVIPDGLLEATVRRVKTLLPKNIGKGDLYSGLKVRPHLKYPGLSTNCKVLVAIRHHATHSAAAGRIDNGSVVPRRFCGRWSRCGWRAR